MNESYRGSTSVIDQPWLLTRRLDGHVDELSLLDVLREAPRLSALVGEVPTQVFALTRLLLAVLHRAIDGPLDVEEWKDLWNAPELPVDRIADYLDRHRERFDLCHPRTPFLQVADLRTAKGEVSELSKLVADIPNGRPFFSGRLDRDLSLSFGEAARWLVHCHAFDPSGIKSGAVGDPRTKNGKGYPIGTGWSGQLGGLMPEGRTLRETLLLNLVAREFNGLTLSADDAPAWERPTSGAAEDIIEDEEGTQGPRSPSGPIDLYTWQSRRVRLFWREDRVVGVLVCNGDRCAPQNRRTVEPHTTWRHSIAQEKKLRCSPIYMPRTHDPKRAIWRDLQSILPAANTHGVDGAVALPPAILEWVSYLTEVVINPDQPLRVRALGMVYGSQNSTTAEIIDDTLCLRAELFCRGAEQVVGAAVASVEATEQVVRAVGWLAGNLANVAGGEFTGPRDRAAETAFAELDVLFRTWLSGLSSHCDLAAELIAWHRQARQVAFDLGDDLMKRAPVVAWVGRSVKGRWLTSNHALAWFHRELRTAVPFAYGSTEAVTDATTVHADRWTDLGAVGTVIHARISVIQSRVLKGQSGGSATLARLRHGGDNQPGTVQDIVEYIPAPQFVDNSADDELAAKETAAHISMTLYALHQQSQRLPMHRRGFGLGRSVRELNGPDVDGPPGAVRRRFNALGTADSIDELVYYARGMVQLLRVKAIPLDYGLLADQLERWQTPGGPDAVRREWGGDFYRTTTIPEEFDASAPEGD